MNHTEEVFGVVRDKGPLTVQELYWAAEHLPQEDIDAALQKLERWGRVRQRPDPSGEPYSIWEIVPP